MKHRVRGIIAGVVLAWGGVIAITGHAQSAPPAASSLPARD
jgi:hypothetical protein